MINCLIRIFLTFSSVSFFAIVFLIQNEKYLFKTQLGDYAWLISFAYLTIPFLLASFSLMCCKCLAKESIEKIGSIETANNDFLANYLAFFFVALSVKGIVTFGIVFIMTILFTFVSRVSYFNPIFLVFKYNFYYATTCENVKVLLISKQKLRSPKTFESMSVRRINDYTFIEA